MREWQEESDVDLKTVQYWDQQSSPWHHTSPLSQSERLESIAQEPDPLASLMFARVSKLLLAASLPSRFESPIFASSVSG